MADKLESLKGGCVPPPMIRILSEDKESQRIERITALNTKPIFEEQAKVIDNSDKEK